MCGGHPGRQTQTDVATFRCISRQTPEPALEREAIEKVFLATRKALAEVELLPWCTALLTNTHPE